VPQSCSSPRLENRRSGYFQPQLSATRSQQSYWSSLLLQPPSESRIRRFGDAIRASAVDENKTRTIALPGIADAMSQMALPMIAGGALRGVLFFESKERLAFPKDVETALSILASNAAAALALGTVRQGTRRVN
jgi:hypothetical protein